MDNIINYTEVFKVQKCTWISRPLRVVSVVLEVEARVAHNIVGVHLHLLVVDPWICPTGNMPKPISRWTISTAMISPPRIPFSTLKLYFLVPYIIFMYLLRTNKSQIIIMMKHIHIDFHKSSKSVTNNSQIMGSKYDHVLLISNSPILFVLHESNWRQI